MRKPVNMTRSSRPRRRVKLFELFFVLLVDIIVSHDHEPDLRVGRCDQRGGPEKYVLSFDPQQPGQDADNGHPGRNVPFPTHRLRAVDQLTETLAVDAVRYTLRRSASYPRCKKSRLIASGIHHNMIGQAETVFLD